MFGLSFSELCVIAVVAFLIFGPEEFLHAMAKLGRIVRTLKNLADKVQRDMMEVSTNLERELNLKERKELKEAEAITHGIPVMSDKAVEAHLAALAPASASSAQVGAAPASVSDGAAEGDAAKATDKKGEPRCSDPA